MKPQSIRSQRSFTEHMKTLYQNIDTMVYASEIACKRECKDCPFAIWNGCKITEIRAIIGDHFPQGDIKEVELSEG